MIVSLNTLDFRKILERCIEHVESRSATTYALNLLFHGGLVCAVGRNTAINHKTNYNFGNTPFGLPAKELYELFQQIDEHVVNMHIDNNITFEFNGSKVTFGICAMKDCYENFMLKYPKNPVAYDKQLVEDIEKVMFSVGSDTAQSPEFCGVRVAEKNIYSTDQLTVSNVEYTTGLNVFFPSHILNIIKGKEFVSFAEDKSRVYFDFGEYIIAGRKIEAEFPIEKIVAFFGRVEDRTSLVEFDPESFLKVLKRVSIFSDDGVAEICVVDTTKIRISSTDKKASVVEEIDIKGTDLERIVLYVNINRLMDAVKRFNQFYIIDNSFFLFEKDDFKVVIGLIKEQ